MTTKNSSRVVTLASDQAMVDGIQKNQAKLPASFPMEGQQMTLAGVMQVFQERIVTGKAVVAADNARKAAVADDVDKRALTRGTALAFKRLLIALFAKEPDVLQQAAAVPAAPEAPAAPAKAEPAPAPAPTTAPKAGS